VIALNRPSVAYPLQGGPPHWASSSFFLYCAFSWTLRGCASVTNSLILQADAVRRFREIPYIRDTQTGVNRGVMTLAGSDRDSAGRGAPAGWYSPLISGRGVGPRPAERTRTVRAAISPYPRETQSGSEAGSTTCLVVSHLRWSLSRLLAAMPSRPRGDGTYPTTGLLCDTKSILEASTARVAD